MKQLIIIIRSGNQMCYLKEVMVQEKLDLNSIDLKEELSQETVSIEHVDSFETFSNPVLDFQNQKNRMICKLFELISRNNAIISNLNQSLFENSQQLEKITINFGNHSTQSLDVSCCQYPQVPLSENGKEDEASLCQRMFGARNYKFSLKTTQKFEETIYKERNFNIGVKLVDKKGKTVRNNNLFTLCLAVCTSDGEWVHENRIGDPFLKGKTEIEMFRGEAQFEKIHAREVSRIYPQGKINMVIYPKPSSLKFTPSEGQGESINSWEIQPLIIDNISIRAKKKQ